MLLASFGLWVVLPLVNRLLMVSYPPPACIPTEIICFSFTLHLGRCGSIAENWVRVVWKDWSCLKGGASFGYGLFILPAVDPSDSH